MCYQAPRGESPTALGTEEHAWADQHQAENNSTAQVQRSTHRLNSNTRKTPQLQTITR